MDVPREASPSAAHLLGAAPAPPMARPTAPSPRLPPRHPAGAAHESLTSQMGAAVQPQVTLKSQPLGEAGALGPSPRARGLANPPREAECRSSHSERISTVKCSDVQERPFLSFTKSLCSPIKLFFIRETIQLYKIYRLFWL